MFEDRKYLVIPTTITGSIDFNQVYETSTETLRLSVDGQWTFVKYDTGNRPSIYLPEYIEYAHDEMLTLLNSSVWTSDENPM